MKILLNKLRSSLYLARAAGAILGISLLGCASSFATQLVIDLPQIQDQKDQTAPENQLTKVTKNFTCGTDKASVTYYNIGDVALANVQLGKHAFLAANVLAGSGSKYVAGPYVWWESKGEASFYDHISDPEESRPLICQAAAE